MKTLGQYRLIDGKCDLTILSTETPFLPESIRGGCFIAGTNVTMSDGSEKYIENVKVGDQIWGVDGNINIVLDVVQAKLDGRELYGFNGEKAFVTSGHPFMTKDGWKSVDPEATLKEKAGMEVGELAIGDTLITKTGNIIIRSLDAQSAPEQTLYDLVLNGDNTYLANNYIVHNKSLMGE